VRKLAGQAIGAANAAMSFLVGCQKAELHIVVVVVEELLKLGKQIGQTYVAVAADPLYMENTWIIYGPNTLKKDQYVMTGRIW
jgi:hypothetical protein